MSLPPRPFVVTPFDQVRREYTPTSATEAAARQMIDAAQAFDGMLDTHHLSDLVSQIDPATYRAIRQRVRDGGGE